MSHFSILTHDNRCAYENNKLVCNLKIKNIQIFLYIDQ